MLNNNQFNILPLHIDPPSYVIKIASTYYPFVINTAWHVEHLNTLTGGLESIIEILCNVDLLQWWHVLPLPLPDKKTELFKSQKIAPQLLQ
jgi:antibiotic biosynthesis monooxygenase (ABM) superfamily enzyme